MKECARVIAFTLFIYFVLKNVVKMSDIPRNFEFICHHLSKDFIYPLVSEELPVMNEEFIQLGKRRKRELKEETRNIHRWNYSIVYAFEFL